MRRRARGAGVIAGLAVLAGVLAGCSASADSAMESVAGGADMGGEADSAAVAEEAYDGDTSTSTTVAEDRSVIVTGSIYMTVDEPIAAADQVVMVVQAAGGRIDGRSETAPDEDYGGSATLTLRIPADQLDSVVERLRELGTIDELSTQSSDVTATVTDLESRISTLRASTARIEGLLADAVDISDIITLEDELASRQAELESLEAQQRGLEDQVSLSTIYLSLTTAPVVVVVDDDSPETFWDGLVAGWDALIAFVSVILVVLGVLLPWLAVAGLFGLLLWVVIRRTIARKPRETRADVAEAMPMSTTAASAAPSPPTAATPPSE